MREAWIGLWPRLGHLHRRMLAVWFALLGRPFAYAFTTTLGRTLYRLLPPLRRVNEGQCRAALGRNIDPRDVPRVAEQAFVHRILNLTDLVLAERWLHPGTYHRFGGRIPEPHRASLRAAQGRTPVILVTAYYGPYDLWPVFLGYNGIRAAVVYRPHVNKYFDAYREMVRRRGGCELIPADGAAARVGQILQANGTVALLADHHARRGMPVRFLGLPTRAMRTVGLLAWRYGATVGVAGIRRLGRRFSFRITVADTIEPKEWRDHPDPPAYVTHRYLRGLERIVLSDPTQYLWGYARWGEELADRAIREELPDT